MSENLGPTGPTLPIVEPVRVRNSRTPIGMPYPVFTFIAAFGGLFDPKLRSAAVESVRSEAIFSTVWYFLMFFGSVLLVYALTSPITPERVRWVRDYADSNLRKAKSWFRFLVVTLLAISVQPFSRPWAEEIDLTTYDSVFRRLIAEEIGLAITGWLWVSYGLSAVARSGSSGFTAFMLSLIVGSYTGLRLFQLQADVDGLRKWNRRMMRRLANEVAT